LTPSSKNPLRDWHLEPGAIRILGSELRRPECILAERDGTLWTADARGGVVRIDSDGRQTLITQRSDRHFDSTASLHDRFMSGTLPNGLAFARNGDFLIANFGTDELQRMTRDGRSTTLFAQIDGKPIGKVNFVLRDSRDRIWLTVSTKVNPWVDALNPDLADGYVAVVTGDEIRVVADGFSFTNEIRFDANEEWLYVVETAGRCITRLRVAEDGSLSHREKYGPTLAPGLPDGIAFDAFGNLWVAMIFGDQLRVITPDRDALTLLDAGDPAGTAAFESAFEARTVTTDILSEAHGALAPWLASVTFGGSDLQTVYLGSLRGTNIPYFQAPVAGLPMVHWFD
jgi:sugar lactone lactonase YvrE